MAPMRIGLRLAEIAPDEYNMPEVCPYEDGEGRYFKVHQHRVVKRVQDPDHDHVSARRDRCTRCGRTFRVYPRGVSGAQRSDRLKGIGVMLYVLGISYGVVEDALRVLGGEGSKSSVYRDMQAAGEAVKRLRQAQGVRQVKVAGADTTSVTCDKETVTIAVGVDVLAGEVLEIELVDAESVEAMRPFINDLVNMVEVEVLISDDQDTYKVVADELGMTTGCAAPT
jgi:hypothetical protein